MDHILSGCLSCFRMLFIYNGLRELFDGPKIMQVAGSRPRDLSISKFQIELFQNQRCDEVDCEGPSATLP